VSTGAVDPVTVIAKGASCAHARPSATLIVMPEVVPMLEVAGVPLRFPVDVLKLAHVGLLAIVNCNCRQRELVDAVGVKENAVPAATLVGGEPEIVTVDAAAMLNEAVSTRATSRRETGWRTRMRTAEFLPNIGPQLPVVK
jgi:hypothetical protein